MSDVNLELQKALIFHAYKNNTISKSRYEELLKDIKSKEENIRLQNALKKNESKKALEKYNDLILS